MKIHTIQLSQWRKIKDSNIELIDITVKNNPNHFFSPVWSLVSGSKKGLISPEEYTAQYKLLLDKRKQLRQQDYLNIIHSKNPIAFACFCGKDKFCHRHVAIEWLMEQQEKDKNFEFEFLGEII